jgi:L-ascorbate metabolism protein UlaG (beta-lactamase superfamily)
MPPTLFHAIQKPRIRQELPMKILNRDCRIRWLGHAAFEIVSPKGKVLLIDPWLTNPKAPEGALDSIKKVDAILLTHGHFDHMGETIDIGKKHQPEIPCIFELHMYLEKRGLENTRPMNKGGTQTIADGIQVTMVNADHSGGISDEAFPGQALYGGDPVGLVIELENGFRIYHAGDTQVFGDMKLIAELYSPELAMLPIGGHFTMGPKEAAMAVKLLEPRFVIPMHYGTFPILTGTPEELASLTSTLKAEVLTIEPGGIVE